MLSRDIARRDPPCPRGRCTSDEHGEVVVTYDGDLIDPYLVRFDLVRAQGVWRIDELHYRGGERLSDLLLR